jgi:hypothetical protein
MDFKSIELYTQCGDNVNSQIVVTLSRQLRNKISRYCMATKITHTNKIICLNLQKQTEHG